MVPTTTDEEENKEGKQKFGNEVAQGLNQEIKVITFSFSLSSIKTGLEFLLFSLLPHTMKNGYTLLHCFQI